MQASACVVHIASASCCSLVTCDQSDRRPSATYSSMKPALIQPIGMVGRCVAGAALVSAPRAVFSPLAVAISRAITSRGAAGAARPSAAGHLAGSSPVTIAAAAKVEAKLGLPAAHAGGGLDAMTSTGAGALASQPRGLGGISSLAGGRVITGSWCLSWHKVDICRWSGWRCSNAGQAGRRRGCLICSAPAAWCTHCCTSGCAWAWVRLFPVQPFRDSEWEATV